MLVKISDYARVFILRHMYGIVGVKSMPLAKIASRGTGRKIVSDHRRKKV